MNKTPLIDAIFSGNILEIDSLIKSGQNVNQSFNGITPIQHAIKLRKSKIVKLLIENKADLLVYDRYNESPLGHIFTKFKESTALSIIKSLTDIHIADIYDRNTALHYAARSNYTKCIDYLISKGANPNALNRQGQSTIFFAAKSGACQSIGLLVNSGVDINLRDKIDKQQWSPVFYAISRSHVDCVAENITQNADVNLIDDAGSTPICYAMQIADDRIVRVFLD